MGFESVGYRMQMQMASYQIWFNGESLFNDNRLKPKDCYARERKFKAQI